MSNDELQKAIDDITSGGAGAPSDNGMMDMPAEASDSSASGGPDLGVAPAPVQAENVEMPAPMPAMETTAPASGSSSSDLEKIKNDALVALYPLLSQMNVPVKQEFDICMKVVDKTGDKGAVAAAFEAAKKMQEPKEKGMALMKIIDKIDTL